MLLGDGRRQLAERRRSACRRPRSPRARPGTSHDSRVRLDLHVHAQRLADALDDALACRRSRRRGCRRSSGRRRPTPVQAHASARRSPRAREKRAPISNSRTSRCSRRRLCATASTRPGSDRRPQHGEGLRQRVGDRHDDRSAAANGAAAASAMKPKVTASENPAPVMIAAQLRAPA